MRMDVTAHSDTIYLKTLMDCRRTGCASAAASALHQIAPKWRRSRARSGRLDARVRRQPFHGFLVVQIVIIRWSGDTDTDVLKCLLPPFLIPGGKPESFEQAVLVIVAHRNLTTEQIAVEMDFGNRREWDTNGDPSHQDERKRKCTI